MFDLSNNYQMLGNGPNSFIVIKGIQTQPPPHKIDLFTPFFKTISIKLHYIKNISIGLRVFDLVAVRFNSFMFYIFYK